MLAMMFELSHERPMARAFVAASACIVFSACGARTSLGLGSTDGSSPKRSNGGDPLSAVSVILFGGVDYSATPLSDTWTWSEDGGWTLERPMNAPPGSRGIAGASVGDAFLRLREPLTEVVAKRGCGTPQPGRN